MRQLRFLRLWISLGWVLVGLVIYYSLTPSPPETPGGDKLAHLLTYAVIMLWFGCIYMPGRRYQSLGVGFIMMGLVLELIQGRSSCRSFEFLDILLNGLGVFLGWLLAGTRLSSALTYVEGRLGFHPEQGDS